MHRSIFVTAACCGIAASLLIAGLQSRVWAHCQVPCGIYDDHARVKRLMEDTTTIDKAIGNINKLAANNDAQSANQLARWVINKESHAQHMQTVIAEYFLAQRVIIVEPGQDGYDAYLRQLADHHAVIVAAMKAKQSSDPATARALRKAVNAVAKYYPDPHAHDHGHSH